MFPHTLCDLGTRAAKRAEEAGLNLAVKEDTGLVDIFSPPVVHTPILKRQGIRGSRFREKLKGMVGGDRGQERKKGGGEGHPERERAVKRPSWFKPI